MDSEEGELFGFGLLFTTVLPGEDGVGPGHGLDDVFGYFGVEGGEEVLDVVELVADVFKLIIEVLAVPCEPVLEGFEEVAGEVGSVAVWIAVAGDGVAGFSV